MSDDFGTVNLRAGDRTREIEVLRQHYKRHREALARMIADAPTDALASGYRRLTAEIDAALGKLDELEGGAPAAPVAPVAPRAEERSTPPHGDPLQADVPQAGGPGSRPIRHSPEVAEPVEAYEEEPRRVGGARVVLILLAALLALIVIGWLVWRASSDRRDEAVVVPAPVDATESIAPVEPEPEPVAAAALAISPASQDYGVIRKGTRATRQFEVTNTTEEPVTIQVARSTCRCLYYEYRALIPPKGKQSVTVTVDGAKAKPGSLTESIAVTAKSDPSVKGTIDLRATIQ
jgi:hypothetical protein